MNNIKQFDKEVKFHGNDFNLVDLSILLEPDNLIGKKFLITYFIKKEEWNIIGVIDECKFWYIKILGQWIYFGDIIRIWKCPDN